MYLCGLNTKCLHDLKMDIAVDAQLCQLDGFSLPKYSTEVYNHVVPGLCSSTIFVAAS